MADRAQLGRTRAFCRHAVGLYIAVWMFGCSRSTDSSPGAYMATVSVCRAYCRSRDPAGFLSAAPATLRDACGSGSDVFDGGRWVSVPGVASGFQVTSRAVASPDGVIFESSVDVDCDGRSATARTVRPVTLSDCEGRTDCPVRIVIEGRD